MDDNQLTLFSEASIEASESSKQITFDWETVVAEVKTLIEEDKALGKQQDKIMERRYEIRIQIGFRLIALQQEHSNRKNGDFIAFAEREFGYKSRSTIYDHINIAEKLENYNVRSVVHYNWMAARELARPSTSDVIIEQVLEGNIEATPEAIKQARKEEAEAKQRAKELEDEKQSIQSQFEYYKQDAKQREESLNARIDELEDAPTPEPQVVYEDTPETKEKLEKLKEAEDKLKQLEEELQDKKSLLQMKDSDLQERTEQRDNLSKSVKELGEELDKTRDANKARHEQEMYEYQINDRAQKIIEEWGKTTVQLLGQLPSPIESQVLSPENWTRIDHTVDMAHRIISTIKQLKEDNSSRIIDAN